MDLIFLRWTRKICGLLVLLDSTLCLLLLDSYLLAISYWKINRRKTTQRRQRLWRASVYRKELWGRRLPYFSSLISQITPR